MASMTKLENLEAYHNKFVGVIPSLTGNLKRIGKEEKFTMLSSNSPIDIRRVQQQTDGSDSYLPVASICPANHPCERQHANRNNSC